MKSLKLISIFIALLVISLPICFADEISIITDANGNLVRDDSGFKREYNGLNQLVRIRNISSNIVIQEFVHDPVEERIVIKKVYNNDGSLKETTYYFDKEYERIVNSSGTYDYQYIYHEGTLIAQINPNGNKIYFHGDNIGSTSVSTNESGDVLERTDYSPTGEIVSGGTSTKYNYENKEFDEQTEDTDFHFRKYKPEWYLFTQADTLIPNVYDPQSLNRYMFEKGNPYKNVDPTGHIVLQLLAWATSTLFTREANQAATETINVYEEMTGEEAPWIIKSTKNVLDYLSTAETAIGFVGALINKFSSPITGVGYLGINSYMSDKTYAYAMKTGNMGYLQSVESTRAKTQILSSLNYEYLGGVSPYTCPGETNWAAFVNSWLTVNPNEIMQRKIELKEALEGGGSSSGGDDEPHPDSAGIGYAQPHETPDGIKWW